MCGELDDDERQLEAKLYARFAAHARALLPESAPSHTPPPDASAYMEELFCDVLSRCLRDVGEPQEEHRYPRLALQPVVFARLAGFLAGHLSLGEDPLHKVMEALLEGYGEAEAMDRAQRQGHDHQHGDVYVPDR